MKTKLFCIAVFGLIAGGCASVPTVPLPSDAAASLSGKTIARSVHPAPTFNALTSGKAMFGVLGVLAAGQAGNDLVTEYGIEDPALSLSLQLQERIREEYGMRIASEDAVMVESDEIEAIRQAVSGADLTVDVVTRGWGFAYEGFDYSQYNVGAQLLVRLIDLSNGEVLAQQRCFSRELPDDQRSSKDELLANDAEVIKSRLATTADHCAQLVAADAFGIESSQQLVGSTR